MIIKDANKAKIEEMIKKVEGRSTARTISYNDIVSDIECIEKELGIPKSHMVGIVANVDTNSQDFPNAYKYTPMSTQYVIERKPSGWDLKDVWRGGTRRYNNRYGLTLTDDAKAAIIKTKEVFA